MQTPPVVRARPRRAAAVCWAAAAAVVVVFSAVATGLRGGTEGGGVFGLADQVAMVGLGLLGAAGILAFTRPRMEADRQGIRVRNVVGSVDLPWSAVRAVTFTRGAPWASLELINDDVVPVMAVQAADREYAVAVLRQMRALFAESRARAGVPPGGRDGGPPEPPEDRQPGSGAGPAGV